MIEEKMLNKSQIFIDDPGLQEIICNIVSTIVQVPTNLTSVQSNIFLSNFFNKKLSFYYFFFLTFYEKIKLDEFQTFSTLFFYNTFEGRKLVKLCCAVTKLRTWCPYNFYLINFYLIIFIILFYYLLFYLFYFYCRSNWKVSSVQSLVYSQSLTHIHSYTRSPTVTHLHSLIHPRTRLHSFTHSLTRIHSFTHSLAFTHTPSNSLTLTHSYTRALTNTTTNTLLLHLKYIFDSDIIIRNKNLNYLNLQHGIRSHNRIR